MDELIRINFDSDCPTVRGRELHAALEVGTKYADWFKRMCDYGFAEGMDYQRTDIGRQFRQYFIKVEESWNSPEAVMARALQFANQQLELVKHKNMELTCTIAVQNQQNTEMKPKASYYDVVLNCKDLVAISVIAKDYGWSANRMNRYLSENGVQY